MLYLASASPRRAALLGQIGLAFEALPVAVDESPPGHETAPARVVRLAALKAAAGEERRRAEGWPPGPVLGADTLILAEGQILGKPADRREGIAMLNQLAGRSHRVLTGVSVRCGEADTERGVLNVSRVTFRALQPSEAEAYWDSGEPADKAGGYAIQGLGALFVTRLDGSYSGVMGLPLCETAQLLDAMDHAPRPL